MAMTEKEIRQRWGSAKEFYNYEESYRSSLDSVWEDCAALTLPYIFPREGHTEQTTFATPYNAIGAYAVNNLASKLLVALLPPTGSFFRLLPEEEIVAGMSPEELSKLDVELSGIEQDVIEMINEQALRVPLYEAIKLLIVTGNALIYKIKGKGAKTFSPNQYIVQRDYSGNVLTVCIKEKIDAKTLPPNVQDQIKDIGDYQPVDRDEGEKQEVNVYTMICRSGPSKYVVWQEISELIIDGSIKEYSADTLPYIALRWTSVANESYGRGLVEQYLGDFRSLEGLTQTIVDGAGVAAKQIFGLRPNATTKLEDLNNADNGDIIMGDLERDVTVLMSQKGGDFSVAINLLQQLEQRLSQAFLMLSGQVRDSERTTAYEVRATVNELESALGGVFTTLAAEFQTPLVRLLLHELNPKILQVTVPSITTGLSAISRERDFQNLNVMLQSIAQLGPEVIVKYLNLPVYFQQVAAALGMDPYKIVKSEEQIKQEEAQMMAQQQQMMAAQAGMQAATTQQQ